MSKKSDFKYSENYNLILRAIADLMRPEVHREDRETGERFTPSQFSKLEKEEIEDRDFLEHVVEPPFPTPKEVAEKTGFTAATIKRHIDKMTLGNFRGTAQALIPQVLASLGRTAIREGKAPEAKLFFQVVGEWEEKSKVDADISGGLELRIKRNVIPKPKREESEE